jgi:hypothetical protein
MILRQEWLGQKKRPAQPIVFWRGLSGGNEFFYVLTEGGFSGLSKKGGSSTRPEDHFVAVSI